jgi:general secretion pathway protein G
LIRRLGVATLAIALLASAAEIASLISERSRYSEARAELTELSHRLDTFYLDNGFYPTTDTGLRALTGHDTSPDPGFVYPKAEPNSPRDSLDRDPWGNRFFYESDGNSYRLGSFGPRGDHGDSPEIEVRSPGH